METRHVNIDWLVLGLPILALLGLLYYGILQEAKWSGTHFENADVPCIKKKMKIRQNVIDSSTDSIEIEALFHKWRVKREK